MSRVILFHKPFGVLSQFTDEGSRRGLSHFIPIPRVYAAGRLDADSEGLLLLTDDGLLQQRIANPGAKLVKVYWAQVEGLPTHAALRSLQAGVDLGDFVTLPCAVRSMAAPADLWPRTPPIRVRRDIPSAWLEIRLREGKNRQVRRMTARIGHPTLRLIRWAIGPWNLTGLAPGQWLEAERDQASLGALL